MIDFADLYKRFHSPITALDCGSKCAPYNEWGVPFCCDTHHAVPAAYEAEWEYVQANSDLWRLWDGEDVKQTTELQRQLPEGQELIVCEGHTLCQRGFRLVTCRAFPFFPYITLEGDFIGLAYYWDYEDRCWVISNLGMVSDVYRQEFVAAYDALFEAMPDELENFRYFSGLMRRVFGRRQRAITLLHRNGNIYRIAPRDTRLRRIEVVELSKFGPYLLADELPFPGE